MKTSNNTSKRITHIHFHYQTQHPYESHGALRSSGLRRGHPGRFCLKAKQGAYGGDALNETVICHLGKTKKTIGKIMGILKY